MGSNGVTDGDVASPQPQPAEDAVVGAKVQLQGAILHVDSLFRTIDFYTRLLDLQIARTSPNAAVLASRTGVSTLGLHERGTPHFTDRTVQALVWHVSTLEALDEIEQRLKDLGARALRRRFDQPLTLLSTRDPDDQRLLFIHYEGDIDIPKDIPSEVYWY
jgi:catechol 2,3-dioxygenase-like lactoylglutathione lyase family enzyme